MAAPTTSIIDPITGSSVHVEPAMRAARVSIHKLDSFDNGGGSYRMVGVSGLMAASTATSLAKLFAFRWAPTNTALLCAVRKVIFGVGELTAFAAGYTQAGIWVARAYTAADVTGATAATMTTNNGKLRTTYPTSQGATLYTATTAAISGGTSTLDAQPLAAVEGSVVATTGAMPWAAPVTLFEAKPGEHPLILANQEGFIGQCIFPATGVATLSWDVTWDEGVAF